MEVIDLTDDSPPPLPPPVVSEPIGINVSVDILDLTEGQSDNEQVYSVPQHLDWNDIAEQRAAHAAFQALRSNPTVAPPPSQSPLARRRRGRQPTPSFLHRGAKISKTKKKRKQQSSGESYSLQQTKKRRKTSGHPNSADCDGGARTSSNHGRKRADKKHPNKGRNKDSKERTTQPPKNVPGKDVKDTEAAAAVRKKKERTRRKNQRRRRNLAARKRAKEQATRKESIEMKMSNDAESHPSESFGAKTSKSHDKSARTPFDVPSSAVRSQTRQPKESILKTNKLKESFEKSESLAIKSAPEPPPVVSQLNVGDRTARNHSSRNEQLETQQHENSTVTCNSCVNTRVKSGKLKGSFEKSENLGNKSAPKNSPVTLQLKVVDHSSRNEQLETQQHQNSTMTSNSCVNTTVKSDKVVDTTRESVKGAVTKSQRVSHDMARNYSSDDLCTESGNSLLKNSANSSGTTVSTEPKNDTITSHVDDIHLETETNVDSQSGESSHPNKEETVSSRINEIVGNKKPLPADVDKARESSDLQKIPNESQPVTVQEESPQEEHQTEQIAEERSNISDKKYKQVPHDHVSLPEMRLYWDKRCGDDEATMENSSMSMRTGEESPTKSNETIGRRQVSNCGTESSRKFCTNPEVIDVDGVESEKEQDETKVKQSKPASDEKSLPAKRQSHTACSSSKPVAGDMGGSPTLKDLIDANAGAGKKKVNPRNISGTKRKASGSQGERKSWQSTVIIVESSDEEKDDNHDLDIGGTTENGPEVEFLKTATSTPSKRRRRGRPLNPETKFKKYPTKREPLEQHLRTNGQYNFRFTEEEAAREQERLFKQAADRVRQNASMANQTSSTAAAGSVPRNINDLSHDHWRSPDLYRRLGLPPGAPIHLVKRQYRRLALRYHPDKGWKDVHTTDRFQAITEAYKVLSGECERL